MGTSMFAVMGMPGWLEIGVVLSVGLLLFGNRLPGVARSLGQSIIEFKRGFRSQEEADLPSGEFLHERD